MKFGYPRVQVGGTVARLLNQDSQEWPVCGPQAIMQRGGASKSMADVRDMREQSKDTAMWLPKSGRARRNRRRDSMCT